MTIEEMAKFNGRDGQPAYVAVSGVIYDVSSSKMWQQGDHVGSHQAGQDLTEELKSAPHVRSVIERFPVVGRIETAPKGQKAATKIPVIAGIVGIAAVVVLVIVLLSR